MVCRTLDGIRLLTLCVYACRKFGQYIERKGDWSMNFLILCLTALGSFGALFWIAKFIGHKQIAQLDFFDYITGITIGSIAAEMATELEEPPPRHGNIRRRNSAAEYHCQQISKNAQIPERYSHHPHGSRQIIS